MLYVTHDLGLLSQIADRVGVMYAGRMVEIGADGGAFLGPEASIYARPYRFDPTYRRPIRPPARPLRGLLQRHDCLPGCPFAPRCDLGAARVL